MLGVGGWKTIVGVLCGAFAVVLPQMKELVNPTVYAWLMVLSAFAGTVLTGLGIAHKIEKTGNSIVKTMSKNKGQTNLSIMSNLSMATIVALLLIGCAAMSPTQNAYNTANASYVAYDTALKSAASMYQAGIIDDAKKEQVIEAGKRYKIAHNAMIAALEAYLVNPDKKQAYIAAYEAAARELLKLLDLVNVQQK